MNQTPVFYDLHIHSCLSPCADDAMTPNNIVNMAWLKGLSVIALTDHNSCGNCRATAQVARQRGLGFLPGMELTTREDVHVICLFPSVDQAESFSALVYQRLQQVNNRPEIFGNQLYCNHLDEAVATEPRLLLGATDIPLPQVQPLCRSFGGWAYPAHIDKDANGLLPILGLFPEDCGFDTFEVANTLRFLSRPDARAIQRGRTMLHSSDAHYLWEISEAEYPFPLTEHPLSQMILQAALQAGLK